MRSAALRKMFTIRNLVILLLVIALFVVSGLLGLKIGLPTISVMAEPVFHIGSFAVTNSLLTSWIAMIVLIILSLVATRRIPKDLEAASNQDMVPSGFQNLMEWTIEWFWGLVKNIAGSWAPRFFPIVMTIFLFVLVSNWLGLLPGFSSIGLLEHPRGAEAAGFIANGPFLTGKPAPVGQGFVLVPFFRSPSADLNFTLALAVIAVGLSQYFGVRAHKLGYFKRFFDFSGFKQGTMMGVIMVFAGILELIAEFGRIISFTFRLFGNVFAGEVLLVVIAFLVPYIASLPFYGLEIFVGFIQAVVFMMLALIFFTMATAGHGSEEQHG
jgi:F-type H+-transporting ATPase subunit a